MTDKRWSGSAYIDLTTLKRWSGSAWVDLTTGKRWTGSAWVDVLPGGGGGGGTISVTASQANLTGFVYATGPYPLFQTVYSQETVTISVVGGTAPYTYSWAHYSGSSAIQIESPGSNVTRFYANVGRNQEVAGIKRCTVTDALGATDYVDVGGVLYYNTDL